MLPQRRSRLDWPAATGRVVVRAVVRSALLAVLVATLAGRAGADFFDDVGYRQLEDELAQLGLPLPTGAGISVSQIEAPGDDNYAPDITVSELSGKTFVFKSGASGISGHATGVARSFYGKTQSMAPDVGSAGSNVHLWNANTWIESDFLNTGLVSEPKIETQRVQNHSWIGTDGNPVEALQRLDYAAERDGFLAVLGMNNGSSNLLPDLLGQSYNTISVGRSDGGHSHGLTTIDGVGRIKPEIVAPTSTTSQATARISSAAAMLLDQALSIDQEAGTDSASQALSIKAALLAGATKDEFGSEWDQSAPNGSYIPLDYQYGAGQLNVYRSYQILAAGEQNPGAAAEVSPTGWDYGQTSGGSQFYFFEVPGGHRLSEFSALLTWNRKIIDLDQGPGFSPSPAFEDLDLKLRSAADFVPAAILDESASEVDNLEHIYFNESLGIGQDLAPGQYALEIPAGSANVPFGLAWLSNLELVLGDMNLDGFLDFDDIGVFVAALNDPATYEATFGVPASQNGDVTGDGLHDFDDINAFVALFTPNSTAGPARVAPEPATHVLAGLLGIAVTVYGRWRQLPATATAPGAGTHMRV